MLQKNNFMTFGVFPVFLNQGLLFLSLIHIWFMAENRIENPEDIKKFDRLGYSFRSDLSSDAEYVFERKK